MTETIPAYQTVAPIERGASFGISFDDYRRLAATTVALLNLGEVEAGIYQLPDAPGCVVDVWSADRYLTIQINSALQQLVLWAGNLDSVEPPRCLLSLSTSSDAWQRLSEMARKEISKAA